MSGKKQQGSFRLIDEGDTEQMKQEIKDQVDEAQNVGDAVVDRETGEIEETPLDAFRRSAGFQIKFVLYSGLEIGRAIDHLCASAEKFSAALREWQPIETAPMNESVLIYIPSPVAEHYGPAIYRGLCVPSTIGLAPVWKVTGLHFGSDCGAEYWPTHWMPLPEPPCLSISDRGTDGQAS